jgi:hypothetical protein
MHGGLLQIQHHHAHIASVIAEHGLEGKVLGIACDGTGYGTDGTIWGSEFLLCEDEKMERIGHFHSVKLLGGDASAKQADMTLFCYMLEAREQGLDVKAYFDSLTAKESDIIRVGMITLDFYKRENLYSRVDRRVDIMMAEGLMFEVRGLYEAGLLDPKYTASGAIGYKELLPVFKLGGAVDVAVAELKMATRHYAKRQLTWFNKKKNYHKIYVDKEQALERAIEILGDFNG